MNIAEILRQPESKYMLIPLATAILGVLAKVISQNDRIGIKRPIELFYLAPNLLVANFIMIICEFSKYNLIAPSEQMKFNDACISALLLNIGATFALTFWIRKIGWEERTNKLKKWKGIIIPDFLSIVVMYFIFKMMPL